jgi:site-specific DNA recombinase
MTRCAIYARYSSDMQRDTSIEDQVRRCEEYATSQGWTVTATYADRAISGSAMLGRKELQTLLQAARSQPRPFDRVLVDDTSRLSRNLPEVLTLIENMKFRDIYVSAVTQGIDSAQDYSRQLFTLNGMIDEQYIKALASKVHRGQEGRALAGFNPGGKCYGYRNVPIEDHTRIGKYGRPMVKGVQLEIVEDEAATVRRIFELFEGGAGLGQIAKRLNADGIPSPQPPRNRLVRAWCPSSIRSMLKNERYRGTFVWNRTQKRQNPETGRKTSRPRPAAEWRHTSVPGWRIVPEPLWESVQARFRDVKRTGITGIARAGGLARSESSRKYLFSGLLRCGCCNSRMVIVSGQGRRGYSKYGCPAKWNRGVCSNRLTIRQDRLETQLLAALQAGIWKPDILEYAIAAFERAVRGRLEAIRREAAEPMMVKRLEQLRDEARRLADAFAEMGHSPTLIGRLRTVESEIDKLEKQRAEARQVLREPSFGAIRRFVMEQVGFLPQLAQSDPERAKAALAKHLPSIVLTPSEREEGPVFEVSGSWEIAPGNDALLMVARDGIEPPTPAFSGLRSTN